MKSRATFLSALRRVRVTPRVLLLLIVLLAFALRVFRLGAQAIWWDESLTVYRATRDLGTIFANTIQIQNVLTTDLQPPLYFFFEYFFVRAFGLTEFAVRVLTAFAGTASVPLLYALGARVFNARVGRVAAFLAALSPFYVAYAQEARPYALVLFFVLLAVYALARAFDSGRGLTRINADKKRDLSFSILRFVHRGLQLEFSARETVAAPPRASLRVDHFSLSDYFARRGGQRLERTQFCFAGCDSPRPAQLVQRWH
ncbi:MAG: glycosyltransferase family 39 protein [Chloroflexi bacterium]|nr:glycosyltransferase family 39 protein [Chloroflexota bacterium]